MSVEALEKASEERAGLIASRGGEVLGAHTILKEDHFPGCQSAKLPDTIPGAPNFRGVPGQNVYGSALPTVEGIKEVLKHVGAASEARDKRKVCSIAVNESLHHVSLHVILTDRLLTQGAWLHQLIKCALPFRFGCIRLYSTAVI